MTSPFPETPPPLAPQQQPSVFSAQGRMGRLSFAAWNGLISIFLAIAIGALAFTNNISLADTSQYPLVSSIIFLIIYIAYIYFSFVFTIKRVHDCNQSGWMSLLSLIPVINFFFSIYLYCAVGHVQTNDYGMPRHTPAWEKIVGWLYILVIPLVIIGVVAALLLSPDTVTSQFYQNTFFSEISNMASSTHQ
ncbi:DUF805 domain-containing protein [Acinetobacter nectaris]|uniref:DUF805 domain-containing protein n=1 Tax=Acinetobacter nectaris TaxID=1219382 RepID=UPI001F2234A4|nr:DUF805 domain-containing protein [Acinetobacter nectaris]MCF8999055.1 DUF805 domain-containing protein [Acinetobacter nectaris]MCF9027319.1 DUF805 domain-containing protein [Acinetobacter nectaris]